jgi:Ca-activated chloride channel homolog
VVTQDPAILEASAKILAMENDAIAFAFLSAGIVFLMAMLGEVLHVLRVRNLGTLAFGPGGKLLPLAYVTPIVRVLGMASLAWALAILVFWPPKTHQAGIIKDGEYRHLVLVLDVSPSMNLKDAGPGGTQTRAQRAADLIQSFFDRVTAEKYKTTIIAFYTEGKAVVKDTADREVIRNILTELPMRHAFKAGETNIFSGLEQAITIAKPWPPGSGILMIVTDGDTLPATGMPKMPASIGTNVIVVGVGNPSVGQSISGHSSRQDVSTLRQTAVRLNGTYHDGNEKHLSTELVSSVDERAAPKKDDKMTLREYALFVIPIASGLLAVWTFSLSLIGTGWTPGRRPGS